MKLHALVRFFTSCWFLVAFSVRATLHCHPHISSLFSFVKLLSPRPLAFALVFRLGFLSSHHSERPVCHLGCLFPCSWPLSTVQCWTVSGWNTYMLRSMFCSTALNRLAQPSCLSRKHIPSNSHHQVLPGNPSCTWRVFHFTGKSPPTLSNALRSALQLPCSFFLGNRLRLRAARALVHATHLCLWHPLEPRFEQVVNAANSWGSSSELPNFFSSWGLVTASPAPLSLHPRSFNRLTGTVSRLLLACFPDKYQLLSFSFRISCSLFFLRCFPVQVNWVFLLVIRLN